MDVNKESVQFLEWVLQQKRAQIGVFSPFFSQEDGGKLTKIFNGFKISDTLNIKHYNESSNLLFENCDFEEISIIESSFGMISFINCTATHLVIDQSRLRNLIISKSKESETTIQKIEINDSSITNRYHIEAPIDELIIHGCKTDHTLEIDSVVNKLKVSGNTITPRIHLNGFVQQCEISGGQFPFQDSFYLGDLIADFVDIGVINGCANNITLIECSKSNLTFDHFCCLNNVVISPHFNHSKQREINFIDCYVGGALQIENCNVDVFFLKQDSDLAFLNYNKINFKSFNGTIKFEVSELEFQYIVNELRLEHIAIPLGKEFKLSNMKWWNVVLDDFICEANGIISDIDHGYWMPWIETIDELTNIYRLKISKGTEAISVINDHSKPTLALINSNLGRMHFMNVNLSKFEMAFHSSKLTDIFLTGSEFPKSVKSVLKTGNLKMQFRQQRIAYTQLKKIYEQHGDSVSANSYFASEMNSYYHSLSFIEEPFEVINLGLNKFSSNHGQSIKSAFLTTFSVSIIIYVIFCFTLGYTLDLSLQESSESTFWRLFTYFPEFLNPVHRLEAFSDLRKDKIVPDSARFIDGVSRIILAYLLYQFIQAFRKHGKKS